jgi:hypothetical protein
VLTLVLLAWVSPAMADGKSRLTQRIKVQIADEKSNGGITVVTAVKMYQHYQTNELAADERYKGEWVQVEGRVLAVAKSPSGKPYVELVADEYGMARIHAQLFSYQIGEMYPEKKDFKAITVMELAVGLRKGQKVIIVGKGKGSLMGIPRIGSCLVIPQ